MADNTIQGPATAGDRDKEPERVLNVGLAQTLSAMLAAPRTDIGRMRPAAAATVLLDRMRDDGHGVTMDALELLTAREIRVLFALAVAGYVTRKPHDAYAHCVLDDEGRDYTPEELARTAERVLRDRGEPEADELTEDEI